MVTSQAVETPITMVRTPTPAIIFPVVSTARGRTVDSRCGQTSPASPKAMTRSETIGASVKMTISASRTQPARVRPFCLLIEASRREPRSLSAFRGTVGNKTWLSDTLIFLLLTIIRALWAQSRCTNFPLASLAVTFEAIVDFHIHILSPTQV